MRIFLCLCVVVGSYVATARPNCDTNLMIEMKLAGIPESITQDLAQRVAEVRSIYEKIAKLQSGRNAKDPMDFLNQMSINALNADLMAHLDVIKQREKIYPIDFNPQTLELGIRTNKPAVGTAEPQSSASNPRASIPSDSRMSQPLYQAFRPPQVKAEPLVSKISEESIPQARDVVFIDANLPDGIAGVIRESFAGLHQAASEARRLEEDVRFMRNAGASASIYESSLNHEYEMFKIYDSKLDHLARHYGLVIDRRSGEIRSDAARQPTEQNPLGPQERAAVENWLKTHAQSQADIEGLSQLTSGPDAPRMLKDSLASNLRLREICEDGFDFVRRMYGLQIDPSNGSMRPVEVPAEDRIPRKIPMQMAFFMHNERKEILKLNVNESNYQNLYSIRMSKITSIQQKYGVKMDMQTGRFTEI
jgi:hypothetical protein